jgi:hypothetical protein
MDKPSQRAINALVTERKLLPPVNIRIASLGSGAFCEARTTMKSIPLGVTVVVLGTLAYLMLGAALAGVG